MRRWVVSKLDVKGVFLSVPLPPDELILGQPPAQWVPWGIVPKDVAWKLNRAVYGLRQSPKWWSNERHRKLRVLTWTAGKNQFDREQSEADSQVWRLKELGGPRTLRGLLCVSACT